MTWFFAILVVLLVGAVAVVAAGPGGSMAEVYDDRPDARIVALVEPRMADRAREVAADVAATVHTKAHVASKLKARDDALRAIRAGIDGLPAEFAATAG